MKELGIEVVKNIKNIVEALCGLIFNLFKNNDNKKS